MMTNVVDKESFGRMISDEKRCFDYLLSRLDDIKCPFCSYKRYYLLSRKRIRCAKCKKDYNPLRNSKFSDINLPYSKWLVLIKLFELSVSARVASAKSKVSYATVLNVFNMIRKIILDEMSRSDEVLRYQIKEGVSFGSKEMDKRKNKDNAIVVGIVEKEKNMVTVDILNDVTVSRLLDVSIKKVKRGNIVYTDEWLGYDSLMFSDSNLQIGTHKGFASRVYIDGVEGFWSFAKEKMKYHDIRPATFLYHIKEMEWRYNNRGENLFDIIVGYALGVNYV